MEQRLAQALADGKITQEQYDAIANGEMPKFGAGERPSFNGKKGQMPEFTDEQQAEMKAKMEERLAQELADGKITQEQYDAMMNGDMPMRGEPRPGRGGAGFPGGMGMPDGKTRNKPGSQGGATQ